MCAPERVCWCGKVESGEVVEWAFREEEPEAERICVGVTAKENMSVGWAAVGWG